MGRVADITENEPHKVSEVICVHCGWRWIAVRHYKVKLRDLECPNCRNQWKIIETGEILEDNETRINN